LGGRFRGYDGGTRDPLEGWPVKTIIILVVVVLVVLFLVGKLRPGRR
jgi:hypothetical protein